MKKFLLVLLLSMTLGSGAYASSGGIAWDKAPNKTNDMVALQNGAKVFVNYCQNCHAASYMRFNRLQDIGLTDKQI
ncbi:MAG: cytochrome c1, partial [Polaromonas sp.]|nr:cytochrome c1 [Polaromonas sp.]